MTRGPALPMWTAPIGALRDRLLTSARFRHWASGFPLTRWIARRRAAELFDLVAGFVYSQVLLACVRLKLFDHLAAGPLTSAQLQQGLALDEPACARLLSAAAALQLVEARGNDRWGLGALGVVLVNDEAIAAMVQHHRAFYADLADPVALLRGSPVSRQLTGYWPYSDAAQPRALTASQVADYSALMSASQPLVSEQVLDVVSLQSHRCLMDVGGGEGRFLAAAARRAPRLELLLVDLPAVAARAHACLHAHGLAARSRVHGADFLSDPLPRGADIVSLVRVVHDHDDASVMALLRSVRDALPAGGTLLLAEPMAGTPGAARMADAYFGLYLLAMQSGRPRSAEQLAAMLRSAGFDRVHERPTRQPLQTRVLLARAAPMPHGVNVS